MLTEAEAQLKECRIGGEVAMTKNIKRFPRCIASACMGWRYSALEIPSTYSPVTQRLITETQLARGYCGYAGRP